MLREIIDAMRNKGVMEELFHEFVDMVKAAEWMFGKCAEAIFAESIDESVKKEIYERDILVNQTERDIRKKLITHLAVQPGADVPACLTLMSICKDAERLGDYSKNLFEVYQLAGGPLKGEMADEIRALCAETVEYFSRTEKVFSECDEAGARAILEREATFGAETEELVRKIAQTEPVISQGVAKAMATRFVKRIFAHLGNIASSIVMPVHKLDYFDEKWLKSE